MKSLMDTKETEEMCWNVNRGSTALSLPEQCVEIVCLA